MRRTLRHEPTDEADDRTVMTDGTWLLDAAADDHGCEFGGLVAVNDVTFTIPPGRIVSLIGPNGAGKTTFFNVLTGPLPADRRCGRASTAATSPASRRTRSPRWGMARTFQNIRLFGLHDGRGERDGGDALRTSSRRASAPSSATAAAAAGGARGPRRRAASCSTSSASAARDGEFARNLSYGDQRRLEVARALALQPKVLLLDEPTAGMNPQESAQFIDFVHRVRDEKELRCC